MRPDDAVPVTCRNGLLGRLDRGAIRRPAALRDANFRPSSAAARRRPELGSAQRRPSVPRRGSDHRRSRPIRHIRRSGLSADPDHLPIHRHRGRRIRRLRRRPFTTRGQRLPLNTEADPRQARAPPGHPGGSADHRRRSRPPSRFAPISGQPGFADHRRRRRPPRGRIRPRPIHPRPIHPPSKPSHRPPVGSAAYQCHPLTTRGRR